MGASAIIDYSVNNYSLQRRVFVRHFGVDVMSASTMEKIAVMKTSVWGMGVAAFAGFFEGKIGEENPSAEIRKNKRHRKRGAFSLFRCGELHKRRNARG